MDQVFKNSLLDVTAKILVAFAKNNEISQEDFCNLIKNLYADLYRDIGEVTTITHTSPVSDEIIELIIQLIETKQKYDDLADLDLRNILSIH